MDQVVRVALNNYRATGKFPTAPKIYQSTVEVRELITNWIMERGTISPSDVFVQNFTLLPPVNTWLSTMTANPVTRSDYADLLWTAFDQIQRCLSEDSERQEAAKPGATSTREGFFFLLGDQGNGGSVGYRTWICRCLKPYTDKKILQLGKEPDRLYASGWDLHSCREPDSAKADGDQCRSSGLGTRSPLPALHLPLHQ